MHKDTESIKFGLRVNKLRLDIGISQEALALKSGINRTYIGEIERGEKSPSIKTIAKLANGLGITKKILMDYE